MTSAHPSFRILHSSGQPFADIGQRKNYAKTAPIQVEEFVACRSWWKRREENDRAWKVPAADLLAAGCNLDRKNPRAKEDLAHLPPERLAENIVQKERRILEIMEKVRGLLGEKGKA